MPVTTNWIDILAKLATAVSVILAVYVYSRQQKIYRLQNLVAVFQRFSNNDDFISIFSLCDTCYVQSKDPNTEVELSKALTQLSELAPEKKFKYLALLEEIAIFAKNSAIMSQNAIHLFKFHFYYIYCSEQIAGAFWKNVGSGAEERKKEGWSYQYEFARKCAAHING